MFDFLNRNLRSYMPELSSARVRQPERVLKIGRYRIPLSRPIVEMRRKSRTFWHILGEHQHRLHHPPRAHHIPAGEVPRPPALGHVHARPARHAGHLRALHHAELRASTWKAATAIRWWSADGAWHGEIAGPREPDGGRRRRADHPVHAAPPRRRRAPPSKSPAIATNWSRANTRPWITLAFQGRARHPGARHRPLPAHRNRAASLAILHADQHRSRSTPRCPSPNPPTTPHISPNCSAPTPPSAWPRTPGRSTSAPSITTPSSSRPSSSTTSARRMFFSALDRTRRGVVACVFDTTDRVQHMFFAQKDRGGPYSNTRSKTSTAAPTNWSAGPCNTSTTPPCYSSSATTASPASSAAAT